MTVTSFDQDAHLKRKLDEMTKELSQEILKLYKLKFRRKSGQGRK